VSNVTDPFMAPNCLAEVSGLQWTYLGGIERGERNLGLVNIVRVAQAVELDPADLVEGLRA
jgi:hypothetical protein